MGLEKLPENLWSELLKPGVDTIWGEVLLLFLCVEAERLFNKCNYVKQNSKKYIYYMHYNKMTGAEFLINH